MCAYVKSTCTRTTEAETETETETDRQTDRQTETETETETVSMPSILRGVGTCRKAHRSDGSRLTASPAPQRRISVVWGNDWGRGEWLSARHLGVGVGGPAPQGLLRLVW